MFRNQEEISNLLDTFATWNRCFTIRDVSEWSGEVSDLGQLRQSFRADSRFILLSQTGQRTECFLPERTLFRWWANFNLRLVQIKQSRLLERQLTYALTSLRTDGKWDSPPVGLLSFGQRFGFVAPAWTSGFCVFPMVRLLQSLSPYALAKAFASIENGNEILQRPISDSVETILSQFSERIGNIVRVREGLPPHKKLTLEQLGQRNGCTRERVRQLESRFWKKIRHGTIEQHSFLIASLLARLMKKPDTLALNIDEEDTPFLLFILKCLDIPYARINELGYVILGISDVTLPGPNQFSTIIDQVDSEIAAEQLESRELDFLPQHILGRIGRATANYRLRQLNKAEKVYLALRNIGNPAHYSEVTETYNWLFPNDSMPERNVHAILSRCAEPNLEQHGIVWIGVRGTYALKENGFERPTMGLFETVASVVEEKYQETGRPVAYATISAELGKYRQIIKQTSLTIAIGCNPRVQQVARDYFMPRVLDEQEQQEVSTYELDRVLRGFREAHLTDS